MENDSTDQKVAEVKLCAHCCKEVSVKARKCPYCQSDLRSWFRQHAIFTTLVVLGLIGTVQLNLISAGRSTSDVPEPSNPGLKAARTPGQEAYLRLPGNNDSTQLICLAPTKSVYDEYSKALMAKDYQGILDLTSQGLFCVHNGSKVKVIDKSPALTKVRVEEGAAAIDSDKIGEAGWSASEWVVVQ